MEIPGRRVMRTTPAGYLMPLRSTGLYVLRWSSLATSRPGGGGITRAVLESATSPPGGDGSPRVHACDHHRRQDAATRGPLLRVQAAPRTGRQLTWQPAAAAPHSRVAIPSSMRVLCGKYAATAGRLAYTTYFQTCDAGFRIHRNVGLAKRRRRWPAPACTLR